MRKLAVLAAAFAVALVATPALAHQKEGHHMPPGQAKKDNHDDDPPAGPGKLGAAHWCKSNY